MEQKDPEKLFRRIHALIEDERLCLDEGEARLISDRRRRLKTEFEELMDYMAKAKSDEDQEKLKTFFQWQVRRE